MRAFVSDTRLDTTRPVSWGLGKGILRSKARKSNTSIEAKPKDAAEVSDRTADTHRPTRVTAMARDSLAFRLSYLGHWCFSEHFLHD
jgi:hypothetical protein